MTRRGLGRGLEALLATESAADAVNTVAPADIRPNPYQPRQTYDDAALEELAASIRSHGLIQPLVVTRTDAGYQLIAGERRWRAAQLAGLSTVPVIVRDAEPRELLALALIENVQREDLGPLEAADAYRRLMDDFDLTQADVAGLVAKSRATVANTLRLLALPDDVKALLRTGQLTEGHARAILSLDEPEEMSRAAALAVAEGWSVREAERKTRPAARHRTPPTAPTAAAADPNEAEAVRKLESALGTRVEIRRAADAGRLVVYFYSDEELQALYERFVSPSDSA